MTNSFKRFLQKCISLYYITLLTTQSLLAPITLLIPQTAYAVDTEVTVAAPTDVALSYDSETHEFTLTGNSEEEQAYILSYETETVEKAVSGDVSAGDFEVTELAGSCSTGTCVYDEPTSGEVLFPDSDFSFSFTISDNITWLEINGGWQVGPVEQDHTYQAPQNEDVQITFTELPENPGYILIKEVELSPEQVEELGSYSNIAYDITSNMENGTFKYNLSLPKPPEANENTRVVYAESQEEIDQATPVEVTQTSSAVQAAGLDHFTIFVVTTNAAANCPGGIYAAGVCYATIQEAIDASSNGDTIEVRNGTYVLSSTLEVNKEVTIVGQNRNNVIIDASGNGTDYGIKVSANNVTLQKFTLIPPTVPGSIGTSVGGGFAIHASRVPNLIENLELRAITIKDGNRTAFDIHGGKGVIINNILAENSRYGNGLSLTGSTNVRVRNFSSKDNAWGGIAIYNSGPSYLNRPSSDIRLFGNTFSIKEPNPIYIEEEHGLAITDITVEGYDFIVTNDEYRGPGSENFTHYQPALTSAFAFALGLQNPPAISNTASLVHQLSTGNYFVTPGMEIARALAAVEAGKHVILDDGTFAGEDLNGTYANDILVTSLNATSSSIVEGLNLTGSTFNGLTFDSLTFMKQSSGYGSAALSISNNGSYQDLTVQNSIFDGESVLDRRAIFANRGWDGFSLVNNTFKNYYDTAFPTGAYSIVFMESQGTNPMGDNFIASNNTLSDSSYINFIEAYRWKNVLMEQNIVNADSGRLLVWSNGSSPVETVQLLNNQQALNSGTGLGTYYIAGAATISGNIVTGADTCATTIGVNDLLLSDNVFSHCNTRGLYFGDSIISPSTASITANTFSTMPVGVENAAQTFELDVCDNSFSDVDLIQQENPGPFAACDLQAPENLGFNENNNDDFALPHPTTEIACGGITTINGISHHWTDVSNGNSAIKYQRQYSTNGTNWSGNEIYSTYYTNYRTFGGGSGTPGTYYSRVRAFFDINNNNQLDSGEDTSEWSANECSITYDPNYSPTWTVSGLKYEDVNGNAVQDESETGLEGWTIKAVDPTPVDTVTIDSGDMAGTDSVTLPAGDYLFIAEGTWNNAGGTYRQNDAEYRSTNGWTTNVDGPNGDLMVGTSFVEWGPYSDQHTYYLNHTVETAGTVNFSVFDGTGTTKNAGWYGDNSGELTVTIYKVYDETVTDANGEYELTIPSTATEVHLYELLQGGWEQTSPAESDHLVATPSDEDTTNYNFGNRLIPELSTITMCKEDSYGEPLEGWTLGLATVTGSELAVPVDGSAVTSQNLPAGDVVVFADGYYNYARTASWQADAGYSYRVPPYNPISSQPGWVSGENLTTQGALEMKINNSNIDWTPYSSDHSYLTLITGFSGGTMTAGNIYDNNYTDNTNTGNFRARFESVVAQGRTDERGCVTFSDAEQGSYTAFELPQEGWEFVAAEQDGDEIGTRHPVDVEIDSAETTIVMINQPTQQYVTLEGYKFDDTNNNGQFDENERYLNNWNIHLFDENWVRVEVAVTGDGETDGRYQLMNIEPDQQYYVCEVEKNAWMQTYPNSETGIEHPRNGSYCHTVTPNRGETISDLNFGNFKLGVLQGRKYEDTQANGEHDGSLTERFLGGWTINLYKDIEGDWQLLDSMVTENSNSNANSDHKSGSVGNGQYRFKNLQPGTYYVCEETQDNWEQTGPTLGSNPVSPSNNVVNDAVAVANESENRDEGDNCWMAELETSGEKYTQLKFGNFAAGTIGGYKWNDEDQDGIWDGIENSEATESALIDWTIFIDENDNQTLDASESATTTSATGEYAFTNVEMDTYSICEVQQTGWTQTYPSESVCHTVTIETSGEEYQNYNFGNFEQEVLTPTVVSTNSSSSSSSGGSSGSTPYQCTDTKPSSAPSLSVVTTGPNSVQLSWTAVLPVSHYAVFFTDQNGQEYGASDIGNTTTYAVTNLNGNTTYSFQVMGVNGCAPGDRSNTATLTEPLIGGAVIGNPIGGDNQILGVTDGDEEEDFSDSTGTGGANPEETTGEVLGEETAVCSQWTIWLPILLLALQAVILLILELVIREPSMNKYLIAVVATIGTLIAAYLLKECNCESVTTVFTLICEWYWILALTILALMRGAGMLFLETEES